MDRGLAGRSPGLAQFGTGVFEPRGNNTVRGNTTEIFGMITTFGPM